MARNKSVSHHPHAQGQKQVMRMPKGSKTFQNMEPPQLPQAQPGQEKLVFGTFWGVAGLGLSVNLTLMYFLGHNLYQALHPGVGASVNWFAAAGLLVLVVLLVLAVRAVVWAAFVASATVAGKLYCYSAQETICHWAMKVRNFLPDKATWASQAVVQLHLTRGDYDKVIEFGTAEYEKVFAVNPKDTTGAGLAAFIGMAYLVKNELVKSIEWNEKAAEKYKLTFESMEKSKTARKMINAEMLAVMKTQYAGVLCQLGQCYLQRQDRRKGSDCLKLSMEVAHGLKDSPEKQQVIQGCEQALAQLKHW
jgi:hypothetical protein